MRTVTTAALLVLAALASSGCAAQTVQTVQSRVQPGLANGPRLGGDTAGRATEAEPHDAIANALDSCPRGAGEGDPLRYRLFACPTVPEAAGPDRTLLGIGVSEPADPYNFHLDGLPPCQGQEAWEPKASGPLCGH